MGPAEPGGLVEMGGGPPPQGHPVRAPAEELNSCTTVCFPGPLWICTCTLCSPACLSRIGLDKLQETPMIKTKAE